jgi:formate dehydrogenase
MNAVRTYCRICEATCGMVAEVDDGDRIVALRPDADHPITRGYACVKGPAMLQVHRDPDRLDRPQRRRADGTWQDVAWDDAVRDIGARLAAIRARDGADAVAVYLGNPSAFSWSMGAFTAGFVTALGTRNLFSATSLDCANKFAVSERMFGSEVIQPIPDLDRTDFFLCLGSNPMVSQMSFVAMPRALERLRGVVARGGRVVFVNPRRTETARAVGEQVFVRPDTDAYLLMAMLDVVFRERLHDEAAARRCDGVDALRRAAARFPVADAAAATGVEADRIVELARAFARAPRASAYCSTGVNMGSHGSLAFLAVQALNAITGNLDRAGGALVPSRAMTLAAGVRAVTRLKARKPSRIGGFAPVGEAMPTGVLADEILTPGPGRVRALVVIAGNPLLSAPGGERLRRALAELELLVSIDLYRNDTAALGHYTLPATDWLEREDLPLLQLGMHPEPYAQISPAVVRPRGERRGEARILVDLARAAGARMFGLPGANFLLSRAGSERRLISLVCRLLSIPERAARAPGGTRLPDEKPGAFARRTRVNLAPPDVLAAVEPAARRMRDDAGDRSLRLIGRRQRRSHNTWMHNVAALRPAGGECRLDVHPIDAAARGISDGDPVVVSSAHGSVALRARLDDDLMPGTVSVPHGWGHDAGAGWRLAGGSDPGANANALAADGPDALEPLSGMCRFNGIPVEVTASR